MSRSKLSGVSLGVTGDAAGSECSEIVLESDGRALLRGVREDSELGLLRCELVVSREIDKAGGEELGPLREEFVRGSSQSFNILDKSMLCWEGLRCFFASYESRRGNCCTTRVIVVACGRCMLCSEPLESIGRYPRSVGQIG